MCRRPPPILVGEKTVKKRSLTPKAGGEQRAAGFGEICPLPPPSPSAHRTSHTAKFAQVLIPLYFTPKHRAFGATENKGMRSGALPQFKGFIRGERTSIYFHRRRRHTSATSPERSRCSLCSRVQAFGVDLGLRAGA